MLGKHPERVIEKAVFGMLPKTALGRRSCASSSRSTPAPSIRTPRSSRSPHPRAPAKEQVMTALREFRCTRSAGARPASPASTSRPASGKWDVNGRTLGDYFPRPSLVSAHPAAVHRHRQPRRFDVKAHVDGGGPDRSGRRAAPRRSRARWSRSMKCTAQAARPRAPDARCARGRAQEARPSQARKRFQFSKR